MQRNLAGKKLIHAPKKVDNAYYIWEA